jgi:TPR repeat protein
MHPSSSRRSFCSAKRRAVSDTLVREAQAEHDRQVTDARQASLADDKAPPTFLMKRAGTPDVPGFNPDAARRAVDVGVVAYLARNYEKAYEFWMPVARTGQADAQFFVGGLYLDGNGVQRDIVEAHTWFARAAEQGHLRAEESLATLRKIMTDSQLKEARTRLSRG